MSAAPVVANAGAVDAPKAAEPVKLKLGAMISLRDRTLESAQKKLCSSGNRRKYDKQVERMAELKRYEAVDTKDSSAVIKALPADKRPSQEDEKAAKDNRKKRDALEAKARADLETLKGDLRTEIKAFELPRFSDDEVKALQVAPGGDKLLGKSYVEICGESKEEGTTQVRKSAGGLAGAAIPLGSATWQTAVLQGLAGFLSKRAEQETVLWAVEQIKEEICKDKDDDNKELNPNPKDLFPRTCALIPPEKASSILPGPVLAAAIRHDLEQLPAVLISKQTGLDKNVLLVLQDLLLEMRGGKPPLSLLAGLKDSDVLKIACADTSGATDAQMRSRYLACGLMTVGYGTYLAKDVATGGADPKELEAQLGAFAVLIADEMKNVCTGKPHLSCDAPKEDGSCAPDTKPEWCGFLAKGDKQKVRTLLLAVHALSQALASPPTGDKGAASLDYAGQLMNLTVGVLDAGMELANDDIKGKKTWEIVRHVPLAVSAALRVQYGESVEEMFKVLTEFGKTLPPPLDRYVSFFVDVGYAKTSADVEAALEAVAAPVGGWRDKRNGLNISLTGFVGLSGGFERPWDTGNGARTGSFSGGLLGAVGLDFVLGGKKCPQGVFVSLLDVGALVSTPVAPSAGATYTDTTGAAVTSKPEAGGEVLFAQVFSPGVFYRLSLGRSPFVFGTGLSTTPLLRNYKTLDAATGAERSNDLFSMWRLSVFFGVDVTMLPIYRK